MVYCTEHTHTHTGTLRSTRMLLRRVFTVAEEQWTLREATGEDDAFTCQFRLLMKVVGAWRSYMERLRHEREDRAKVRES